MAQVNIYFDEKEITQKKQTKKGMKVATLAALLFGVVGLTALTYLGGVSPSQKTELFQLTADASPEEHEVMKAYINFIAEYGKQYSSKEHASKKYEVFKKNYEQIKEHNKHEKVLPFVMSVNQFADMTPEEFAKLNGVEIPKVLAEMTSHSYVYETPKAIPHHHHHHHSKHHQKLESSKEKLPDYVNWFEKGAVSAPQDQQTCGSCWAFTTAATMEALSVISGQYKKAPKFSMQQLLDCDVANDGCDGGWMYKAYNYTANFGMMNFDDYPYKVSSNHQKCLYNETRAVFKNKGMVQEKNMNNEDLKARLAKQPVGVGIYTNKNFMFYKKGIMTEEFLECSDPKENVNHGVTVVGYGKTKDGDNMSQWCEEYWIVRNTWGTRWGEDGFFRLCMDGTGSEVTPYGACQLNRYPTYPTMEHHEIEVEILK